MNPENNLSTKEAALLKLKQKRTKPFGLGQFGGGGAGMQFSPIQEEQFELKKDTLWVPVQQSYNEAFANARKKGLKTFMFNGELKNTELGNDPKAQEAGSKRFQNVGLIPIERTKKIIPKKDNSVKKHFTGGRLDIKGLMNDPEFKKNHNLYINSKNISIANDSLINRGANNAQIGAVLTQIISESGGETKPHGNGAYGLIGWRGARAKGLPTTLSGQLHHLMKGLFESHKDWSDGGPGMNIGTGKEMQQFFKNGAYNNYRKATNAVMNGYVRPPEDQKAKRHALVQIVKRYMK